MDKRKSEKKFERNLMLAMVLALIVLVAMSGYISKADANEIKNIVNESGTPPAAAESANQYEGIIRFHVIANSDSEEDQALKLKVRNQVIVKIQAALTKEFEKAMIEQGISHVDRAEVTRKYIEENLNEIQSWAEEAIQAEGFDYTVRTNLGVTYIPAKRYDDVYFPAGNYEALNIKIGKAEGQNWWCVIFPPLCLIDAGDQIQKEQLDRDAGSRIVLKSRILELLDRSK